MFLVIYGLQRCRDLRRREDDFGFGRAGDEPPDPAKQFADLLRDGAGARHSHADLVRHATRISTGAWTAPALRELAMRVVFQMSVADSSNLIDNPLAGKLGIHRALFASEEDGRLEKFRPYGPPSEEWLDWVKGQLCRRRARRQRMRSGRHSVGQRASAISLPSGTVPQWPRRRARRPRSFKNCSTLWKVKRLSGCADRSGAHRIARRLPPLTPARAPPC